MSTKIFVGRLSDGTTNDELHALFRKFGTVTESVAMGNYGFVVSRGTMLLSNNLGSMCHLQIVVHIGYFIDIQHGGENKLKQRVKTPCFEVLRIFLSV